MRSRILSGFSPILALAASAVAAAPAWAATLKDTINDKMTQTQSTAGLGTRSLTETVGSLINGALGLLGVVMVVLFIYAGFLWMTAAGNKDNIDKAKQILISAVIGSVILMAAYAIATFVINAVLTGTATT